MKSIKNEIPDFFDDETLFTTEKGQTVHVDDRFGDCYYLTYFDKNGNFKKEGKLMFNTILSKIKNGNWKELTNNK